MNHVLPIIYSIQKLFKRKTEESSKLVADQSERSDMPLKKEDVKDLRLRPNKLQGNNKKRSDEEQRQLEEDPFLILGYGLYSYYSMISVFILCFIVISLCTLPMIFLYGQWAGPHLKGITGKMSIGAFGYASHDCVSLALGTNKVGLSCKTGNITNITHYGVVPSNSLRKDVCINHPDHTCVGAFKSGLLTELNK